VLRPPAVLAAPKGLVALRALAVVVAARPWLGRGLDLGELHLFHLLRQAHSGVEGAGVEDLHHVAERQQ
jgi:hypothetical protein